MRWFDIKNIFLDLVKTKTAKQTAILFSSQILAIILNIMITPIITRNLGPEKYGIFVFIVTLISFASLFFEFGFFSAGARLLSSYSDKQKDRELIAVMVIITTGISFVFFVFLFIFSYFINQIFHTIVGDVFRAISFLAFAYPFQYMSQQVCQGSNEIKKIALANVGPEIWFLTMLLVSMPFLNLNVLSVLIFSLVGTIISTAIIIVRLRPKFKNLKHNWGLIWRETKEYGFHTYIGRIIGTTSFNIDKILISYFRDTLSVGFYNIAALITMPIPLLSQSLSTSLFKGFAYKDHISKKIIIFNAAWLILCVVCLFMSCRFIIIILFSSQYLSALSLVFPLAIAGFFQGMYQPFNMFLGAHRKGKWLRDGALMITLMNFFTYVPFIIFWGAMGAAIASVLVTGFEMCVWMFYYKKSVSSLRV